MKWPITIIILIALLGGYLVYRQSNQFEIPKGTTTPLVTEEEKQEPVVSSDKKEKEVMKSTREILITDGVKHSIPLGEILSGGPPKDGIPSIDGPQFISTKDADEFLDDDSIGLGLSLNGEIRFYPYQILVWHEIVNDNIAGDRVLVTYCPLCGTAIVFDPEGKEFGVSGKLWQSNLLMYDRTGDEDTESLWSQVLGESVLGPETGTRLSVISSDTVRYSEWKKAHPETKVLSRDTGSLRTYGVDPYGDYYTDIGTIFPTKADNDDRLHPKELVLGVEIDNQFKAYQEDLLPVGETLDTFAGKTLRIEKSESGEIRIFNSENGEEIFIIRGFWFSWLAVHPESELYLK